MHIAFKTKGESEVVHDAAGIELSLIADEARINGFDVTRATYDAVKKILTPVDCTKADRTRAKEETGNVVTGGRTTGKCKDRDEHDKCRRDGRDCGDKATCPTWGSRSRLPASFRTINTISCKDTGKDAA